jgi:hypothetical protein
MATFPTQVEGVELTPVPDGAVIYESDGDHVHYLNPTAALVFALCDGTIDAAEIARLIQNHFKLDEPPQAEIELLLTQFLDAGIITEDNVE